MKSNDTKKLLANSLKELMQNTPLDKITVKKLVEHCEVNRQTFYYHFKDIYDLLGWIYKREAIDNISNCKTYKTWQQGFLKIFYYVNDNKEFCLNTFNSMARDHLEHFLYIEVFKLLFDVVNEICSTSSNTNIPIEDKTFIANFYTFAFIGILTNWLKSNMKDKPEKIIDNLNRLIVGDIEKSISSKILNKK